METTKKKKEKRLKEYIFTVTLSGIGKTPDEAYIDACKSFELDWGPTPNKSNYTTSDKEI